jgi:hypothetical protein
VPGLPGKGIIDLLLPTNPADIARVTQALFGLGFQRQVPEAFPPTRPMLWGVLHHGSTDHRVHVHVVPSSSPEVAAMRGFRDALRADPALRHRYAALKRAIVAGGPVDPVTFTGPSTTGSMRPWAGSACPAGAASTKRSQPGQCARPTAVERAAAASAGLALGAARLEPVALGYRDVGTGLKP